jgi:hypothetical protein
LFTPYLSVGAGVAHLKAKGQSDYAPIVAAGLGYIVPLGARSGFEIQPEVRLQYTRNEGLDESLDDQLDAIGMLRLRYRTGTPPPPARVATNTPQEQALQAPPSAEVASASAYCGKLKPDSSAYIQTRCDRLKDRDRDTVPDGADLCPNTIPGVRVDVDGCLLTR